jgi:hypothetical protein
MIVNKDAEDAMLDQARIEENKKRSMELSNKEDQEADEKRRRQQEGLEKLQQWEAKRKLRIKEKRKSNIQEEKAFKEKQASVSTQGNTWEKVMQYLDIAQSNYKGTKDVTRMRQVLLAKKNAK